LQGMKGRASRAVGEEDHKEKIRVRATFGKDKNGKVARRMERPGRWSQPRTADEEDGRFLKQQPIVSATMQCPDDARNTSIQNGGRPGRTGAMMSRTIVGSLEVVTNMAGRHGRIGRPQTLSTISHQCTTKLCPT